LSEKQLLGILQGSVGRYGQGIPVVFYGDGRARHSHISRVMDICGRAGLHSFSFAAFKEKGE